MMTKAISKVLSAHTKDLGGFSVRRLLPAVGQKKVGPWVFFDHMGPAEFAPGDGIDVRPHPHINLATVTYLFEGQIFHRDSLGNAAAIEPGDINLMVAGHGIVHSERTAPDKRASGQRLHGLQLWLALPEEDEECEPQFYHYPAADLPCTVQHGVPVRVMMGSAYGCQSPVKTFAYTLYVEADLKAGQSLKLPYAEECALYVASGEVSVNGEALKCHDMGIIEMSNTVSVQASSDARIAIVGGESLPQRHIEWNFVSSQKARIEAAKDRWQAGRFPKVPGDEDEFIPLP